MSRQILELELWWASLDPRFPPEPILNLWAWYEELRLLGNQVLRESGPPEGGDTLSLFKVRQEEDTLGTP